MKLYRCRICGETYLGSGKPSDCPFCGADQELIVLTEDYPEDVNRIEPTEAERTALEASIELERSNTRFYLAMAARKDNPKLTNAYMRLASIEAMHCSVFCKLAEAPKPADLMEAGEELGSWDADIDDSLRRETHASTLYAEFAGRATTPRLVEVWKEVSAIEADHIELDGITKRYSDRPRIRVTDDGPYLVTGDVPFAVQEIGCDENGRSAIWIEGAQYPHGESRSLCRCGRSSDKPRCDGSHVAADFDGTETASREPYAARADTLDGPGLVITDVKDLCAEARFCARRGGIWNTVANTDDLEVRDQVQEQAQLCPSGRYVPCDKESGQPLEPVLEPSLGLVEYPSLGVSGGIWVRAGIPVESADGHTYEVRNRVTLCRCGQSKNKPFCDGTHVDIGFNDEG